MGRAPRVLWGWAPTQTTTYEYTDGLLTASTTVTEPEFDAEQVDWLVAYSLYKADLTPGGFSYSETTSEDADPDNYDSDNPVRFLASGPFTDFEVKARMDAQDAYVASFGEGAKPNLNGKYWTVQRKVYGRNPDLA